MQVEIPATGERRCAGLARWVDGELLAEVVTRETDSGGERRHFASWARSWPRCTTRRRSGRRPRGSSGTRWTRTGCWG